MPSTRPSAAFEPISPDFDVKALVESTPNFEYVVRIRCDMIDHQGLENFEKLVLIHVILGGKPLVVEGYHERLDRWTFALQWLRDNCGGKIENARDLTKKINVPLTISHYLYHMALLTNQWTDQNYKDSDRQRMYLKDIDCPQLWHDKLRDILPPALFYLNESTGDVGGMGATDEPDPHGSGSRRGRGVAKAGDLMSSLPKEMRAENLMCYIGHEGTYTPAHREMCASLGQNIMVECSHGGSEDMKSTKPGSSIWFMTESKERHVVSEYWLSRLGHDIEVENHFAQVNAWKAAPFKVYVVEQRVGDLILIPPLAPHQVWNRGTRTMKVAWNRTTIETLEMALHEALPRARMVCRDEQYKNKAMIYFTLQKYSKLLKQAEKARQKSSQQMNDNKFRQVEKDFRRLQALFTEILVSESFLSNKPEKGVELLPFESFITCSYCRCNIFNRFLTCPTCVGKTGTAEEDTYDVCMECYAMGRSCACISKLQWVEQFPWSELVQMHEQCRLQILQTEGRVTEKSPKPLKTELERRGTIRTLAQICQLELQRRPFNDITKPSSPTNGVRREEETEVDENGNVKKKRKIRKSDKFIRDHARCHVDCHWEPKWKQAACSTCDKRYCYGVLYRAYDICPQTILGNPSWKCPSCQNICGCRHCKHRPGYKPYSPSTTMLGHNTKAVADPRSVESLVDFSFSNIGWIQKAGDDHEGGTLRLNRHRRAAEAAKAQNPKLGEHYVAEGGQSEDIDDTLVRDGLVRLAQQEGIPIDPALITTTNGDVASQDTEDECDENPEGSRQAKEAGGGLLLAPQYTIPDGGIMRNTEHAYEMTDAITYDYPDPETAGAPQSQIPEPAEPKDTYEAVVPESPGRIEMVNHKRKRLTDEGDQPFKYKKKKPPTQENSQLRKSLLVKLPVNREKLAAINKMAIIAQRALSGQLGDLGVSEKAPKVVVGSDLSALNAELVGSQQGLPKKSRLEQVPVEQDDEFTPSRYRDRRKTLPDAPTRPPPDTDITRRTTRMQAVTYEEPSDGEEFDEALPATTGSKLATMERAADGTVLDVDSSSDEDLFVRQRTSPKSRPIGTLEGMNLDGTTSVPPQSFLEARSPLVNMKGSGSTNGVHISPRRTVEDVHKKAKARAEAEANRRAKMAAFEEVESSEDFDESDDDNDWSGGTRQPAPTQPSRPVAASKPTQSLQTMKQPAHDGIRQPPKVSVAPVASAAEWADDSSDDDSDRPPAGRLSQSSWTAVNSARNSAAKLLASRPGRRTVK